jgi:hypothetical protein
MVKVHTLGPSMLFGPRFASELSKHSVQKRGLFMKA